VKTLTFKVSVFLPEVEEGNKQDEDMLEEMIELAIEGIEEAVKKSGLKLNEVVFID
jgi:enamine deaminase RidA (YjgF/YER057c/UK114 family)